MAIIKSWQADYKNNIRVDLIDLTLAKDELGYYLSPRYRVETSNDIREIYIPKARLNIDRHMFNIVDDSGECLMYCDINGVRYYDTLIETKTKEMSLEEIEEKLGHKVKIISKETT